MPNLKLQSNFLDYTKICGWVSISKFSNSENFGLSISKSHMTVDDVRVKLLLSLVVGEV